MKKSVFDIIRRPIVTEKSNYLSTYLNQYVFEVDYRSTKTTIKEAIETIFDVKVERVNVMIVPAKQSRSMQNRRMRTRSSAYKKAIVTLAEGERIPIFEGVE
ncbi:MAG TPA: 50S ribosomal protein L23 [Anaerolineaceae bacterium]|jgi:large subunit ribosomal protein L23|nr:MAG: 50S ribosomal protein L23 [Anaerolineaceae bacterium 46_22]HAF47846.1 50S ribosomal protein L23 [Anaerolineaceae bacterium]